jgi:hypothetical protein
MARRRFWIPRRCGAARLLTFGGILRMTPQAATAAAMLAQDQQAALTLGGLTMLLSIVDEFRRGGDSRDA